MSNRFIGSRSHCLYVDVFSSHITDSPLPCGKSLFRPPRRAEGFNVIVLSSAPLRCKHIAAHFGIEWEGAAANILAEANDKRWLMRSLSGAPACISRALANGGSEMCGEKTTFQSALTSQLVLLSHSLESYHSRANKMFNLLLSWLR